MRYCGRDFSDAEIGWIRELIANHPDKHRTALSRLVCEELNWLKHDGKLKEMSCRVAMLRMERDGLVRLPPPRKGNGNGRRYRRRTGAGEPELIPVTTPVKAMQPLELSLVNGRAESFLWNEYIDRYHYLGYHPLPGAQLRYFARWQGRNLALLGFGAAAWKAAPRDRFIGWTKEQRERNLHLVVNNARFLILPWVRSRHLASKLLGMTARRLPRDWQDRYGYRPVLLETFVEIDRFKGTCYKAANWTHVGNTQGRGKLDVRHQNAVPIKSIWLYPLDNNFSHILCSSAP